MKNTNHFQEILNNEKILKLITEKNATQAFKLLFNSHCVRKQNRNTIRKYLN